MFDVSCVLSAREIPLSVALINYFEIRSHLFLGVPLRINRAVIFEPKNPRCFGMLISGC
jgi:hypothetical protein